MAKLPNPIHAELNSLHLAVRRLVRTSTAASWKGTVSVAEAIAIEQDLSNAEETYLYRLKRVNELLIAIFEAEMKRRG